MVAGTQALLLVELALPAFKAASGPGEKSSEEVVCKGRAHFPCQVTEMLWDGCHQWQPVPEMAPTSCMGSAFISNHYSSLAVT